MVTTRSAKSENRDAPPPQQQQKTDRRLYRGNCHCGAFVYEVELPEIRSALECDCSICHKKGYLWVFPGEDCNFVVVEGTDNTLTRYSFGPGKLTHRFCPTCATPVMADMAEGTQRALNVRAIQGIDVWALEKQPYHGASIGEEYVPPKHKGSLPSAFDGLKLYTGSCHCGAVTLALTSEPLEEDFDHVTAECNCSVCGRNGYRWAYPSNECVVLSASDPSHLGRYSFARHVLNKTFCKICGVCMTNEYNHITEEERKALGALPARGFASKMKAQHPVNLRVFPDVDLTKLKPPKLNDGAKIISPRYKNP